MGAPKPAPAPTREALTKEDEMTTVNLLGKDVRGPTGAAPAPRPPAVLAPGGSLLGEAPALNDRDWLPEGAFPELDALCAEHVRLLDLALAAAKEIRAAEHRFAAEDAAYSEAFSAQALGDDVELPELTPPETRAAEISALQRKAQVIGQVREKFARHAVEEIANRHDDWTLDLDERDAEIEARVEEARRVLAEATGERGKNRTLRRWLRRTAGHDARFRNIDGRHIAFPNVPDASGPAHDLDYAPPEPREDAAPSIPLVSEAPARTPEERQADL